MSYIKETERLETFFRFPKNSILNPKTLAEGGFIYLKQSDTIVCAFCGIKLSLQALIESPILNHQKLSPNCPFLSEKPPLEEPGNEPKIGEDVCGGVEPRPLKKENRWRIKILCELSCLTFIILLFCILLIYVFI